MSVVVFAKAHIVLAALSTAYYSLLYIASTGAYLCWIMYMTNDHWVVWDSGTISISQYK